MDVEAIRVRLASLESTVVDAQALMRGCMTGIRGIRALLDEHEAADDAVRTPGYLDIELRFMASYSGGPDFVFLNAGQDSPNRYLLPPVGVCEDEGGVRVTFHGQVPAGEWTTETPDCVIELKAPLEIPAGTVIYATDIEPGMSASIKVHLPSGQVLWSAYAPEAENSFPAPDGLAHIIVPAAVEAGEPEEPGVLRPSHLDIQIRVFGAFSGGPHAGTWRRGDGLPHLATPGVVFEQLERGVSLTFVDDLPAGTWTCGLPMCTVEMVAPLMIPAGTLIRAVGVTRDGYAAIEVDLPSVRNVAPVEPHAALRPVPDGAPVPEDLPVSAPEEDVRVYVSVASDRDAVSVDWQECELERGAESVPCLVRRGAGALHITTLGELQGDAFSVPWGVRTAEGCYIAINPASVIPAGAFLSIGDHDEAVVWFPEDHEPEVETEAETETEAEAEAEDPFLPALKATPEKYVSVHASYSGDLELSEKWQRCELTRDDDRVPCRVRRVGAEVFIWLGGDITGVVASAWGIRTAEDFFIAVNSRSDLPADALLMIGPKPKTRVQVWFPQDHEPDQVHIEAATAIWGATPAEPAESFEYQTPDDFPLEAFTLRSAPHDIPIEGVERRLRSVLGGDIVGRPCKISARGDVISIELQEPIEAGQEWTTVARSCWVALLPRIDLPEGTVISGRWSAAHELGVDPTSMMLAYTKSRPQRAMANDPEPDN